MKEFSCKTHMPYIIPHLNEQRVNCKNCGINLPDFTLIANQCYAWGRMDGKQEIRGKFKELMSLP